MKKILTIFTPAYNRAHTIDRTYYSLCNQTCKEFEWLIIDDGSRDCTRELVRSWYMEDSLVTSQDEMDGYSSIAPWLRIHYVYQQNQGMHGAHNTAYKNITTELNTCIDSDDYMPIDAVKKIVDFWNSLTIDDRNKYAGFIGLDYADGGGLIGKDFPADMKETTLQGYYESGGKGDKKLVYKTEIINKYPEYPIFDGEKYVGLAYKYMLIDQDYKLLTLNEPLVIVDYQIDGSSFSMYKQYWNNPKGFAFFRKTEMTCTKSLIRMIFVCGHYVSSCIISKNKRFVKESPKKAMTLLAIPIGILLFFFIKYKVQRNKYMIEKNTAK